MPWSPHHPPHLYLDNTWYIVTSATYQKLPLLRPEGCKNLVAHQIRALVIEFDLRLIAWVILDNHYHLLVKSSFGTAIPRFFARLHGRTSFDLNKCADTPGRRVWHNYWDTCIRSQTDFWTRFNYIHHNPIKHGYISQLEDWPFSSYQYYLKNKGKDWLQDAFRQYPVIDFTDQEDDF